MSEYRAFQFTLIMVFAVALAGLHVLTGCSGQISLGHGAFCALGAYAAAILMHRFGVGYGWTVPLAGLLGLAAGYLFGLPALRLQGAYLALATFALGVSVPQMLKSRHVEAWTGGVQGIVLGKPQAPFGWPLAPDVWLYLFVLGVTGIMFMLARNLVRGRIGRAMAALRDAPIAATASGIDVAHFKAVAFGISAMYAAVSGALGAIVVQYVAPDSFATGLSISLLVGIVVGGVMSLRGAVFGAAFIQWVPELADQTSKAAPWAVYGVLLVACGLLMPAGIDGALRLAGTRIWQRRIPRQGRVA